MGDLLAWDYTGGAFELFGPAHLGALAVMAALGWWIVRSGKAGDETRRATLRRGLVVLLLANELAWHLWCLSNGQWHLDTMLPLQACSFMVWWTAWALWYDRRSVYAPIYYMGIAGAAQALITPDAGIYGFPHFRFFQTLIAHGVLVVAGVWVARVDGFRATWRNLLGMFAALNGYALVVYFVNLEVGSNYLYVNGKPTVATLIDFMPSWPWYIPILEVLTFACFVLLLLPHRRPATATR